jgi:hypothetical protein
MIRTHLAIALLVLSLTGAARAADKPSSKDLKALFEKAEAVELYSLDPGADVKEAPDAKHGFHGWKILGKTTVKDAKTRKKIVAAMYQGLEASDGTAAKCFNPRHGIRVMADGKTVDVVICFECLQVQFHVGDASKTETTTDTPQKVFDEVLRDAGVPLAVKKK